MVSAAPREVGDPFGCADSWRLGGPPAAVRVELEWASERLGLDIDRAGGVVAQAGGEAKVTALREEPEWLLLEIDGARHEFHVELRRDTVEVVHQGARFEFREPLARADRAQAVSDGALVAPMPGTVLRVSARPGDSVATGEVVVILEAMKMELSLTAPFAGTVAEVKVSDGEQVTARQLLVRIAEDHSSG
jgi:3-methylcrotonyl-CoA carboxylase alpha subunit/acetyl-CoA/propionyl-CoA carboxylase biotin carboxyl carrier protein